MVSFFKGIQEKINEQFVKTLHFLSSQEVPIGLIWSNGHDTLEWALNLC